MSTKWKRRSIGLLALALVLTLYLGGISVAADSDNLLVVKLAPAADIDAINATYETTTVRPLLRSSDIYLLKTAADIDPVTLIEQMGDDPAILTAESNILGSAPEANSRDTYAWPEGETSTLALRTIYEWEYGGQNAAHYENQPAMNQLNLGRAHTISRGHGTVVAILDTGLDMGHPLLAPALTAGAYDFIDDDPMPSDVGNGRDDDGDGAIDEAFGHGTHIAGIINLVAPEAALLPLRVLDADGQGHAVVIAEAIYYAVAQGADVISLSLGMTVPSPALEAAVEEATAAGVVVVAASGNLETDVPQFPAAYACAVGVTAVDNSTLHKADYANYGDWVSVAAPGERIYSTYPYSSFSWWKGTSMATPFVSAQAALLLAVDPSLSPTTLTAYITESARPIDQQNPDYAGLLGAGRIELVDSLELLASGSAPINPSGLLNCTP